MAKKKSKKKNTKRKSSRAKRENTSYQRGIWKGSISFGLVNIGVRVISAKEKDNLSFKMLDPSNLSPIGYRYYNKSTGEEVPRSDTVKAFEYKDGRYVVFTDADFKKANPKATQTIDIENFVKLEEIDPVFFKRSYYLAPMKGSEKAYKLLVEALEHSKKVAIAKIILHTRQHLAALIPRGDHLLLELLHFSEEIKELRELESLEIPAKVSNKEVEMAEALIDGMSAKWNPDKYKDTYREDILKQVNKKVRAGKATEITQDYDDSKDESTSEVLDLMPLLKKSLAKKNNKKPAKSRRAR